MPQKLQNYIDLVNVFEGHDFSRSNCSSQGQGYYGSFDGKTLFQPRTFCFPYSLLMSFNHSMVSVGQKTGLKLTIIKDMLKQKSP